MRWQDGRCSSEVAEMCGVEDISVEEEKTETVWTYERDRGGRCCVRWGR